MVHITAKNLCLDYPIVGVVSQSLKNHLLSTATGGVISGGAGIPVVNALRSVDFEMAPGDRVGLIGHNGAGKSTLLKVLAGIYQPTSGHLMIKGRVVSTLNLTIGMEQEATGYENIVIRGLMLGMKLKEILKYLDEISEFTELGNYLDMPVRIYSSGMQTRLAFATVTAMHADILLMDEVITTGDASFMDKAEQRLKGFMNRSSILVLATHSDDTIRKLCNRALLLDHGQIVGSGAVEEMLERYHQKAVA